MKKVVFVNSVFFVTFVALAGSASAQQRPLVTEDPEPIGAGRVLIEGGIDGAHNMSYPASGLKGDLWRVPTIGVSVGISSIAEIQIDGGVHDMLTITSQNPNAPLASLVTATGDSTHDVEDTFVGMKIRLVPEAANHPAFAIRFATKLGNASVSTGMGTHTTDFYGSILVAKTVQSIRVVGNIGGATLEDPTGGYRQNDVLTYGLSFARAMTQQTEVVGEINGRASVRSGDPFPGTESRGILKLGGRYTRGAWRGDAGIYFGLTTIDPTIGFTAGFTYVFNAFTLP
ncbi:MAG TPA: hypothetical protein VFA59_25280 [Vicinamibacterales bacterium]|nr:hypothetical protein [Vicinamibacterales bacterium]